MNQLINKNIIINIQILYNRLVNNFNNINKLLNNRQHMILKNIILNLY